MLLDSVAGETIVGLVGEAASRGEGEGESGGTIWEVGVSAAGDAAATSSVLVDSGVGEREGAAVSVKGTAVAGIARF